MARRTRMKAGRINPFYPRNPCNPRFAPSERFPWFLRMGDWTMKYSIESHRQVLGAILRWTARVWGIASTLLLLAFAFGGRENLRFSASEAVAFLFFPVGVI